MCPIRDIDDEDMVDKSYESHEFFISCLHDCFLVKWISDIYKPETGFIDDFSYGYSRIYFRDDNGSCYVYRFAGYITEKLDASQRIATEIVKLFRTMVDGKISIVYKEDAYKEDADESVYFEQHVTPSFPLNQVELETAISHILNEYKCEWEVCSEDYYIPENVVFYLNRVSEDAFKSIGQKVSVGEEQHNAIPLKYEIGLPKKSPFYMPHPIYPSILEPNRKYIDSGFEDAKSSYTNSKILIDIKLLQSHKELFQYRIYLAIAMLYFYECAHFLMDNGFVLEDGILHLDKHSVKYLAYLTLESDNIAEVAMEESVATAFMLNCIKSVAPDDYPVAEKIVQETWSPACRFGLKQLEVGAKWQDWREAKTHKDSLQLNEWFEKYFSDGNINDSIAYEPKDYKRALGLS